MKIALAALLAGLAVAPAPALACSATTDCTVRTGLYRVAEPEGPPKGALLFFHGWQGSAEAEMRNTALANVAHTRDLLLVIPDGLGKSWSYPGAPRQARDEFAFIGEVMADVEARFGVTTGETIVSGFSIGGSMAWNVACYMGGDGDGQGGGGQGDGGGQGGGGHAFKGFAPIAGAYWDPIPEACPSPVPLLIHTHGTSDRTVPLAGRPIGESARQSDVHESLAQWTRQGSCEPEPARDERIGPVAFDVTSWRCLDGGRVVLKLHPGGHSIRTEWLGRSIDEIDEALADDRS